MKNMLKHHGYYGAVEYSDENECFFGKAFGINDLILSEGDSMKALKADFYGAVSSYLESCKKKGKESDKFYKGSFNICIAPELHKKAALAAGQRYQTSSSFVESAICTMVSTIL